MHVSRRIARIATLHTSHTAADRPLHGCRCSAAQHPPRRRLTVQRLLSKHHRHRLRASAMPHDQHSERPGHNQVPVPSSSPPPPSFSSASPPLCTTTCFSCPPVLVRPSVTAKPRPQSSHAPRSSPSSAPPRCARPSSARAPFHLARPYRPPSPRSHHPPPPLDWSSSSSSSSSPATPAQSFSPSSSYRWCTQRFFLASSQPRVSKGFCPFLTTASLAYGPPPPSSTSSLSYHHQRYQADYAYTRSYSNLFPLPVSTPYHTSALRLAVGSDPGGRRAVGQPRPARPNGHELIDPVVPQSKFRSPAFVCVA